MNEKKYDLIVIGAGPGGYPAAIRAAQTGARVALIEKQWVGGTCLHCGCIPTKTLIAGASLFRRMQQAAAMGICVEKISVDYPAMISRKNQVISSLEKGIRHLLKTHQIDLFQGRAQCSSPNQWGVTGEEGVCQIEAEKIIIATGSRSIMPTFIPHHEKIMDSQAFLELTELPESLLVLGGGYIGCEFACLAAALGVPVTLVEMLDDILLLLDRDVRSEIKRNMKKMGITLLTKTRLENIEITPEGNVQGIAGKNTVTATHLLVAVGRQANTDGLNLNAAGVETAENGTIKVDHFYRTTHPDIYAVGDVNGGVQLAHVATFQGISAAEHAFGGLKKHENNLIPGVIFTMPEAAIVGDSQAILSTETTSKILKTHYRTLGKAAAEGETNGFVKWVVETGSGRLLGAQAVGAHATELIAEATLAIQAELTADDVANTIHAHPTFSEAWMDAATAFAREEKNGSL